MVKTGCCDNIIKVQENIIEHKEKIENLEKLYTPVARLTVMFYIGIFILGSTFTVCAYTMRTVEELKTQVILTNGVDHAEFRRDIAYFGEEIKSLKRALYYQQQNEEKR